MGRDHVETLTLTASAPHWVPPMSCANVIVTGERVDPPDRRNRGHTWCGSPAEHARNSVTICGKTLWPLIQSVTEPNRGIRWSWSQIKPRHSSES